MEKWKCTTETKLWMFSSIFWTIGIQVLIMAQHSPLLLFDFIFVPGPVNNIQIVRRPLYLNPKCASFLEKARIIIATATR